MVHYILSQLHVITTYLSLHDSANYQTVVANTKHQNVPF